MNPVQCERVSYALVQTKILRLQWFAKVKNALKSASETYDADRSSRF